MLTDYFEPFTLLKSASCPDPYGGQLQQDVTEQPFRAALADALGEEGERGGKPFIRVTPYLLCPPETPLKLDDIIRREKDGTVTVALVGYTNAGKSTLMNLLTQAGVLAEDKLFATLDPTARALKLPGGKTVMLIDTVGLVRRLPHHLVEAFRSTLEQAATADIILNVCDASSPEARTHLDVTNEILQSLGCGDRPVIPVLNKWDLVGDADSALHLTGAVRISALKNEGIPALLQAIEDNLPVKPVNVTALLPFAKTGIAAQLRKAGALVSEEYVAEGLLIHARAEPREMALIKPYIVENNSESENE